MVMIVYAIVERKSGKAAQGNYGHNIGAMGVYTLDQRLTETGIAPLGAFLHEDIATLEKALPFAQPAERIAMERRLSELRAQPEWHDPAQGLATVRALLAQLGEDEAYEGVASDLRTYQAILEEAAREQDLFRLNLISSD
jgi:hypothetical protein